ncbi:hypothetical protein MASR2M47_15520 [Draconibacterium sp.]
MSVTSPRGLRFLIESAGNILLFCATSKKAQGINIKRMISFFISIIFEVNAIKKEN